MTRGLIDRSPSFYSYHYLLPYIPLLDLNDAINKYLRTVRPLVYGEKLKEIDQNAFLFKDGKGPLLGLQVAHLVQLRERLVGGVRLFARPFA